MTEKTNKELEFQAFEVSDSFSQMIEEECKEAAALLVEGEELTEEEAKTVSEPFQAAVRATVKRLLDEEVVPHYEGQLGTLVEDIRERMTSDVSGYLEFIVEDFIEQNKDALIASQTAEQDRTIVEGLQNLLRENYVEVPEGRKDLVEEMNTELSEANSTIENLEEELIALRRQVKGAQCEKVFNTLSESLESDAQRSRFMSLVEDLDIDDVALFEEKATKIRDSFFGSGKNTKPEGKIEEEETPEGSETLTEETIEEGDGKVTIQVPDFILEAARLGSVGKNSGYPRR